MVKRGYLKDILNTSGKLIDVRWEENENGIFEIVEHPPWRPDGMKTGAKPLFLDDLYVSGCDSFDAVEEEMTEEINTKSLGCQVIYNRFYKAHSVVRFFVANITQRTGNSTQY